MMGLLTTFFRGSAGHQLPTSTKRAHLHLVQSTHPPRRIVESRGTDSHYVEAGRRLRWSLVWKNRSQALQTHIDDDSQPQQRSVHSDDDSTEVPGRRSVEPRFPRNQEELSVWKAFMAVWMQTSVGWPDF